MSGKKLTKEDLAWIHKQVRQGNYVPPLTLQEAMGKIDCCYCGFPIKERLIDRIKGKPYHEDCIKVKDWVKTRERRGSK